MIVTLHGERISGRSAVVQTNGDQWLALRMKEQNVGACRRSRPDAGGGRIGGASQGRQYAFEGKWDGYRLLVEADHGELRLRSRSGREVTKEYPQLGRWQRTWPTTTSCSTARWSLDKSGVPSFNEMQNRARASRVEYWAFDLLEWTAAGCCGRDTKIGESCWKPWPGQGAWSSASCCPGTSSGAGALARTRLGRRGGQEMGFHLSTGTAVVVVD